MRARPTSTGPSDRSWARRDWLAATLRFGGAALCLGGFARGADETSADEDEVQARARKAGLGPFRSSVIEPYFGIGDAPDAYRNEAVKRCRALAKAYQKHFQDKGLTATFPSRRMTVVTLKDQASYAAFLGEKPGDAVGGHYDLDTNHLVIFDFRPGGGAPAGVNLEQINAFTLIHEATHQLTFNTGLLDRRGDVPVAVSEGLAMYAELWRPDGRSLPAVAIGVVNRPRLKVLIDQEKQAEAWIPLGKLLTDDTLFQRKETEQLAYAEAWVLVHYLLKTPAMLPKSRAYLDAIRPRRAASDRLADAAAHLGALEPLNLALRKHAAELIRGRGR
jgi:hypothetical protein